MIGADDGGSGLFLLGETFEPLCIAESKFVSSGDSRRAEPTVNEEEEEEEAEEHPLLVFFLF